MPRGLHARLCHAFLVILSIDSILVQYYVIVRPQSTVEYTSVVTQFVTGWMCPLKREQAMRERERGLRDINSLQSLLWR